MFVRVVVLATVLGVVACSDDPVPAEQEPLPAEPQIAANLLFVTFPLTVAGGTAIADVVLTNVGRKTLTVEAPSVSNAAFSLPGSQALSIASRASASVRIQFAPSARGVFFGELEIDSNAENAPQLALELFGPARSASAGLDTPDIGLAEESVSVSLDANEPATSGFVRVFNVGRKSLFLRGYSISDNASGFFALNSESLSPGEPCGTTVVCEEGLFCDTDLCALSVPSGRFTIVDVRYAPTSSGTHSATLRIESNDPDQAVVTVPITGTK